MIRAIAFLVLAVSGALPAASAAEPDPSGSCFRDGGACTIGGLRTPTSPAFVLIGVSPTQVERPTTPQDVAATWFDLAATEGGVPRSLALEVAPYWLVSHPRLTFDRYVRAALLDQLAFNATVSVATAPVSADGGGTDLAVGVRSHIFIDLASPAERQAVKSAEALLRDPQEIRNLATAYKAHGCGGPSSGPACTREQEMLDAKRAALQIEATDPDEVLRVTEERLPADAKRLQDALGARAGIVLSLAVAASGRTPADRTIRWDEPNRSAAWINFGYDNPMSSALAVVRYTHVNKMRALELLDTGARIVWTAPRFSLSGEYLRRWVLAKRSGDPFDSSDRFTSTIEFPVTGSVWISATAGQDAATETRPSALITLVGVSFQTSRERRISVK